MPVRAVVFDLDNTLIFEDESTHGALRSAAALAAARTDAAGVDALAGAAGEIAAGLWRASPMSAFGDAFGIWWGEALWGEFSGDAAPLRGLAAFVPGFRRAVWAGALARVGIDDDGLADAMVREYIRARRSRETIDPEAEPLLRTLASRYRMGLLTNGAGDVQREKLSRTPFARYLAAVIISVEVGVGKPDPQIFRIAAARLGIDPGDAVMVGDSLERDVAGAKAAGMRAVWIDRKLWNERETASPDAR
ncbi:MAG: HAD family hydrolase, partial [Chloroflexota bacterium]